MRQASRRLHELVGGRDKLAKLLRDDQLPSGVSRERAERELCERKVAVFERMLADGTTEAEAAMQLAEARARLAELTSQPTS